MCLDARKGSGRQFTYPSREKLGVDICIKSLTIGPRRKLNVKHLSFVLFNTEGKVKSVDKKLPR